MSDKRKWDWAQANDLAEQLREELAPVCERIVIAGSLRRRKPLVGDIELLFIPRFEERAVDLVSTAMLDVAHEALGNWLASGVLSKRPSKTGSFTWGPKNKLALHRSGIPVDFFATTAENWWVSLVIRTGGKETNLKLTTGAQARGRSLMAYGCGVRMANGDVERAQSERDVFQLCGVPYLEPEARA